MHFELLKVIYYVKMNSRRYISQELILPYVRHISGNSKMFYNTVRIVGKNPGKLWGTITLFLFVIETVL